MRVVVVGAGAWGLPAAAELARRGHEVIALDTYGVGNALASSGGATRIWRLTHPHVHGVRLALRQVEAWRRLEARTDSEILLTRGLLWRDPGAEGVAAILESQGVASTLVEPKDVATFFPALRPTDDPAVWQDEAGPLLAEVALAAEESVLTRHGGEVRQGTATHIESHGEHVRVELLDGESLRCDRLVLAPGPGAGLLLRDLGIDLELRPVLEQVGYVQGDADWAQWPCVVDTEGTDFGFYGLPTPGIGFKLGNDFPLRDLLPADADRTPDGGITAQIEEWAGRSLIGVEPVVTHSQVCSWTNSPDGWFVVDRVADDRVVLACGDSGQGFKFSALMGEVLADLTEGADADEDIAPLSLARFGSQL